MLARLRDSCICLLVSSKQEYEFCGAACVPCMLSRGDLFGTRQTSLSIDNKMAQLCCGEIFQCCPLNWGGRSSRRRADSQLDTVCFNSLLRVIQTYSRFHLVGSHTCAASSNALSGLRATFLIVIAILHKYSISYKLNLESRASISDHTHACCSMLPGRACCQCCTHGVNVEELEN